MHIQRTLSTYYLSTYKTAVSECECGLFFTFDICYLTFALKLVTYRIFETFYIRNLIFRYFLNMHILHFAMMPCIGKRKYLLTYSLFTIRSEVGYLSDIRNIGYSNLIFRYFLNKHILPFALMLCIVKREYLLTCI